MAEGWRMWEISLLTIMLLTFLSAAPIDITDDINKEDVKADNDAMHSHDENVTRAGKFFGHNRFDIGNINVPGNVAGDDVSIGHQVNIDVQGHTHYHEDGVAGDDVSIGHQVNIDVQGHTHDHENGVAGDDDQGHTHDPHHHEADAVIECKEGLRELFKSIDSNKDGLMDAKELLGVCHQNNIQITEPLAVRILTLPDKTVGFNIAKFCELLKDCPSTNSADSIYFLLQLFFKDSCSGTESDWACCSSTSPCQENEGDCDTDDDCVGFLECGKDNCRNINPLAYHLADCCIQPVPILISVPIDGAQFSPLPPETGCQDGTITRDKDTCRNYMFCVNGQYVRMSCSDGLYWDAGAKTCNYQHLVDCKEVEDIPTEETTSTPDSDNRPPSNGLSGDYKIVCYFTNWATYRRNDGNFDPEHIDPEICTHIVYGFAVLDENELLTKSHDPYADMSHDYGKDMYGKVTEFKKHGIKVILALGGWNDSEGNKYSRLVNNPAARAKFIKHVIAFIEKHDFDGLDLDWEYPSCWQNDCKKENYGDKAAFTAWVSELRAAFTPKGLLLSAAVSPNKKNIDVGYDIPSIARDLDWIGVMSYDYHGEWDKKTGHNAPFYGHPDDDLYYFNANFTMKYWIESGAPANKLVMGMPLYGRSFTLENKNEHGLNAPARGGGTAGPATGVSGFLAYHEICRNIRSGWTVVKNEENPPAMGPYAYYGNQWVGFDDKEMIRQKSQYVRDMGLGGAMVWSLDLDDFKNKCGEGRYPLINTIKEVLGPAKQ